MHSLSVIQLQQIILIFCDHIITKKKEIDSINVFPVPDRDTGSNLAATFFQVKRSIYKKKFATIKQLQDSIETAALTAAQGNSGIIFVGFFSGFLSCLVENKNNSTEISINKLSKAFQSGAEKARDSIDKPQKGTVLDVMDATVHSMRTHSKKTNISLEQLFYTAFQAAQTSLQQTRFSMPALQAAGVVDAGALGFLVLVESFYTGISKKTLIIQSEKNTNKNIELTTSIQKNKFEVVCIIKDSLFTTNEIKKTLQELGNSIDVIEVQNNIKIHIHTDQPELVKEVCVSLGTITLMQLSDMEKERVLKLVDLSKKV